MFDKLSLEGHEKWSLSGSFLIIISSMLPWYRTIYPNVELPWNGIEFSGNVYGYSLLFGRLILLLVTINIATVLYTSRKDETTETYLIKLFSISILSFIFLFRVLSTVLLRPGLMYFSPHVGLVVLFVGVLATIVGLKKNYSEMKIG